MVLYIISLYSISYGKTLNGIKRITPVFESIFPFLISHVLLHLLVRLSVKGKLIVKRNCFVEKVGSSATDCHEKSKVSFIENISCEICATDLCNAHIETNYTVLYEKIAALERAEMTPSSGAAAYPVDSSAEAPLWLPGSDDNEGEDFDRGDADDADEDESAYEELEDEDEERRPASSSSSSSSGHVHMHPHDRRQMEDIVEQPPDIEIEAEKLKPHKAAPSNARSRIGGDHAIGVLTVTAAILLHCP